MSWNLDEVLDSLVAGLSERERELSAEHAVHGLDALPELGLHAVLAGCLERADHAVFREVCYPRLDDEVPKDSERDRCDLVLAPSAARGVSDRVGMLRERARASGTLFEPLAESMIGAAPDEIDPADALWLEVKTIGQFAYVDGFSGPNRAYASQFGPCVGDVRKLSKAKGITSAALVLVLFSETEEVAEHDLTAFAHKCLDRGLPLGGLRTGRTPVTNRIGNAYCSVALVDVRRPADHSAA